MTKRSYVSGGDLVVQAATTSITLRWKVHKARALAQTKRDLGIASTSFIIFLR